MVGDRAQGVDLLRPVRQLGPVPRPQPTPTRPPDRRGSPAWSSTCTPTGVDVRPLVQVTGEAEFNEVFLDDVFVPDDQVLGGPRRGLAGGQLDPLPRARGQPAPARHPLPAGARAARAGPDTTDAFADWRLRQRLAEAYLEVKLFQLHNWRTLTRLERGEAPGPEGSALKLYWSEMSKRLHETVMAVLGPSAGLWQGAADNPGDGCLAAVVALLPGIVHLRRDQRDPAHPGGRAGARIAEGLSVGRVRLRARARGAGPGGARRSRSAGSRWSPRRWSGNG